jgi:AraC-like DNA-binding protein
MHLFSQLTVKTSPGLLSLQRPQPAIDFISEYPEKEFTLLEHACLCISSLIHFAHEHPPLQYQKHLHLQEARRLILAEAMDAPAAAYHVGYMRRSQLSREYIRLFRAPPLRVVEQTRQQPFAKSNVRLDTMVRSALRIG